MQENELDNIRNFCSCAVGETDPKREGDQTDVYLHVLTNPMVMILEPIAAGVIVSLFNRFLRPRIVHCLGPPTDANGDGSSSESSAINADTEVHVHAN